MERRLQPVTDKVGREKRPASSSQAKLARLSFWDKMVIILVLGSILGVVGSRAYYERRLEEAIKLQRFVHKNIMYEIREIQPVPTQ